MKRIILPGEKGKFPKNSILNQHLPVGWTERWEHGDCPAVWRFSKNPCSFFLGKYIINPCLKDNNFMQLHIL
jgi:hypothetical protein